MTGREPDRVLSRMRSAYTYIWWRGILTVIVIQPVFRVLLLLWSGESETSLTVFRVPAFQVRALRSADGRVELFLYPLEWMNRLLPSRFRVRVPLSVLSVLIYRVLGLPEGRGTVRFGQFLLQFWKTVVITAVAAIVNVLAITVWVLLLNLLLAMGRAAVTTARAVARTIPTVLAVLFIGFATSDAWRLFGQQARWRFGVLAGLLVAAAVVAMVVNMRDTPGGWQSVLEGELVPESKGGDGKRVTGVDALHRWRSRRQADRLPAAWPPVPLPFRTRYAGQAVPHRDMRHLVVRNVTVVYWLTMSFSVIWMAVSVFAVFVVIGVLAMNLGTTNDFLGSPPGPGAIVLRQFGILGQHLIVTSQLLQLSAILGAVAALTFATSTLQDADSRAIFEDHALTSLRRALVAVGYYLAEVSFVLRALEADGTLDTVDGIDWAPVRRFLYVPYSVPPAPPADSGN